MGAHQGRVVILASKKDPHVELVSKYLSEKPIIVDFGDLQAGLSYRLIPGKPTVTVTYDKQRLDLSPGAVKSVWNRRTNIRWLDSDIKIDPPEEQEYALSSLQNHADVLKTLFQPDVFWVSGHQAIVRANQKPLQLQQAQAAGFHVPATLFTSDPQEAEAFVKEQGDCIVKTQASLMPKGKVQHTMLVHGRKLDFRGLSVSPQIFQELIKPDFEVRAAVIGDEVFASVVRDTHEPAVPTYGTRDFRASFLKGTFTADPIQLPKAVAASCVYYVRQFGLACGYFDLICDKKGTWWFIECNANGQWGFVDMPTVDKIAESLARLLESGTLPRSASRNPS